MLKQFFELIRGFLILTHDVQENRKEIEDLRREMDKMQDKLHQLALLFQQERAEREQPRDIAGFRTFVTALPWPEGIGLWLAGGGPG